MATFVRLKLQGIKRIKYHHFTFEMQDAEKITQMGRKEQLNFFQALIMRRGLDYRVTDYFWYNPEVIQPWELSLSSDESTIV